MKAGFSLEQADFLFKHATQPHHTHSADEIIVDPKDDERLEHFIDELVDTGVFEEPEAVTEEETEEDEEEEAES